MLAVITEDTFVSFFTIVKPHPLVKSQIICRIPQSDHHALVNRYRKSYDVKIIPVTDLAKAVSSIGFCCL
jgi:hypothetical protein